MKLVQFGAGKIGRSFIGQLFSKAGWEVVFVDISRTIIDEMNRRGKYTVEIRDKNPRKIIIENIRGVYGDDTDAVSDEVSTADIVATAVGKEALPKIMRPIALGLVKRWRTLPSRPLDIIICENMRDAASFFKKSLISELPPDFPFEELVGLVETSIGKMVPLMSEKDRQNDPLLVYAEAYNTLIVDKKGFKGRIPEIPEIEAKDNMKAYVDRKLYIHNLGHAVLAYCAFASGKGYCYVWEAAEDAEISDIARKAMWEAGRALIAEYPREFTEKAIGAHIENLMERCKNRALGDTIYRVGRDLYRKLGPDDRLVGALNLCLKHNIHPVYIAVGIASALFFKATDEHGRMYDNDRLFHEKEMKKGARHVLRNICNIGNDDIISFIVKCYEKIKSGNSISDLAES